MYVDEEGGGATLGGEGQLGSAVPVQPQTFTAPLVSTPQAVGFAVPHGRVEGLHLTGVVATADAEDDPAVGEDIGHGKILGQAQKPPHRIG
jgi:hypothetical protein